MTNRLLNFTCSIFQQKSCRSFSRSVTNYDRHSCKVLVVGGGSGGCTVAAKLSRKLGPNKVIVLEPSQVHYYQPLFTLVAAGVRPISATCKATLSVLPSNAEWFQDAAANVDAERNVVTTAKGDEISYEFLVIAVGIQNNYDKIPGLLELLNHKHSGVTTIYSPQYSNKMWADLQRFRGGEAVFTYPDSPIKCPGAPQKITYLTDSYLTKKNLRSKSNVTYNTCLPVIFGVKKYADALMKVVEKKNIKVRYQSVLKEIRPERKEAVFHRQATNDEEVQKYDLLHVTPPMAAPAFIRSSKGLGDEFGYLDVDKYELHHVRYKNIYGLGDCTNTPNSKTAAAISKQAYVVEKNLLQTMKGKCPTKKYDGYGACPLVTSYNTAILAEFLYDGVVHETFPFNQAQESRLMYYCKRDMFPFLYWNFFLPGWYNGTDTIRRIINPLGKN